MPDRLNTALVSVYGEDPQLLREQRARYQRGLAAFASRYGPGDVVVCHAPGRVNLIGEHTDYNHGYVLPMALDKDVLFFTRGRSDAVVNLANVEAEFGERRFVIESDIPRQPVGDWANYPQGPAQLLAQEYGATLCGMDVLVDGAPPHGVPRGAGLSSSSAVTVAAMAALVGLNGLPLEGARLAESCSRAEWYVGTRGGIMDHFISVLGQRDHALFLDCRPAADGSYITRQVPIPSGYAVLVIDSGVRHKNTGPHFNRRVAEGRIGVRLLRHKYPAITHLRDVNHLPWSELELLLPEVIQGDALRRMGIAPDTILDSGVSPQTDTFFVRKRCRHVISENNRVLQSVQALESGDVATFGRLLAEAHASARDDYEISTPEIEVLVRLASAVPGTVGARLTGAGWGGCIVAMVRREAADALREAVLQGYARETGREARVFVCRSAAGAGETYRATV